MFLDDNGYMVVLDKGRLLSRQLHVRSLFREGTSTPQELEIEEARRMYSVTRRMYRFS